MNVILFDSLTPFSVISRTVVVQMPTGRFHRRLIKAAPLAPILG
jgi:hypothetical protein